MFFRKKHTLREKYDEHLYKTMEKLKKEWLHQTHIYTLSAEDTDALDILRKLSQAKYFYLFTEAKERHLTGSYTKENARSKRTR